MKILSLKGACFFS